MSRTLQIGFQLPPDDQLQTYALTRHALLWLADELHLPAPNRAAIDAQVKTLRYFSNPNTGQFDPMRYNRELDELEISANPVAKRGFARVLADDTRIAQLEKLLAGPGFLLPTEARNLIENGESSWTVAVASVDYGSFAPAISTPATAVLEKFFADNPARFTLPAQVRVDAIEFATDTFLAKVPTLTDKELRDYYDADRDGRYPKPDTKPDASVPSLLAKPADTPQETAAKADAAFAAAKPKVTEDLRLDRAHRLAEKAAAELTVELDQKKPADLAAFLAAHSLTLKPYAPFAARPPAPFTDLAMPVALGTALGNAPAALRLSATQPYTDALPTANGAVVLVWRESFAPKLPAFAEVRERVAAEWQADEKQRLFTELGHTLHARFEAALKAGSTLDQAVTEAAGAASSAKIESKTITGFTLDQKRQADSSDLLAPALTLLDTLQKGQLGEMIAVPGPDGKTPVKGLLVYAVDKKLPDFTTENSKDLLARMYAKAAALTANAVVNEIVRRELPAAVSGQP